MPKLAAFVRAALRRATGRCLATAAKKREKGFEQTPGGPSSSIPWVHTCELHAATATGECVVIVRSFQLIDVVEQGEPPDACGSAMASAGLSSAEVHSPIHERSSPSAACAVPPGPTVPPSNPAATSAVGTGHGGPARCGSARLVVAQPVAHQRPPRRPPPQRHGAQCSYGSPLTPPILDWCTRLPDRYTKNGSITDDATPNYRTRQATLADLQKTSTQTSEDE